MSVSTLPSAIGGWSILRVTAGLWVSESARPVPAEVLRLPAEAGRLSVIVDADAPSPGTDSLLADLFPALSSAGVAMVRLVLSAGAGKYALAAARAHGFDIIAAEAEVTITPHGYALVRPAGTAASEVVPQWRRYLPSGESLPAGMLSSSPPWERGLTDDLNSGAEHLLAVHRVPAGVAAHLPGPVTGFADAARAVWPDPERLIIVVEQAGDERALLDGLTALVGRLPRAAVAGVRLWWPRVASRASAAALQELARRCATDLIAPAADVSLSDECGGVCHGPMGAAPWVRFSPAGAMELMGSLYPAPDWERALARVSLAPPPGLVVEQVAAGLGLYRQDGSAPSLAATARSLIPDPARATIVVGGEATSMVVRRDLETIVGQLPADARRSLRIALTAAGSGGPRSYAQSLADMFESLVVAPDGVWTATSDGRLLARSTSAAVESDGWREFWPRYAAGRPMLADVWVPPPPQRLPEQAVTEAGPSDPPLVGGVPAAVHAVLAAQDLRLVRIASNGDGFYSAAAAALRRVFGWVVPDQQVLRDWLAAGLRTDARYRDALAVRVAHLLSERRAADDVRGRRNQGVLITGQDWEQIAVQIESGESWENVGSDVAPDLLASSEKKVPSWTDP